MASSNSMDNFTPPSSDSFPISSPIRPARSGPKQNASYPSVPPTIPPPPTDLPEGYRAVTSSMSNRRASIETDPDSPRSTGRPTRSRRGSLGHMVRTKSNKIFNHEVHKVVTPTGKTVLRKQTLRPSGDQESEAEHDHQRSEGSPQNEAPRISMSHLASTAIETRPDSLAMFGSRTSNFSRPYTATTPPPAMLNGWSNSQSPASYTNSPSGAASQAFTSPTSASQPFTSPPHGQQSFFRGPYPTAPMRSSPSAPSTPGSNANHQPLHSPTPSYSLTPTMSPPRPHTSHHPSTSPPDMNRRVPPTQPLPPIVHASPKLSVDVGSYVSPYKSTIVKSSGVHSPDSITMSASVASPRRIRRRKDPTPFNVMVVGATNAGKSSFVEYLRSSFPAPSERHMSGSVTPVTTPRIPQAQGSFHPSYTETELDGERVALTLWDSQSLEKNVVDLQLRELVAFVESKFEDTFNEEQKVARTQGAPDTHIHCVFLLLDPTRLDYNFRQAFHEQKGPFRPEAPAGLDPELDISILKGLTNKTAVIPVISKADSLTRTQLHTLKQRAWRCMQDASIDPLAAIELMDDDDESDSSVTSAEFPPEIGLRPMRKERSNDSDATKDSALDYSFSSSGKSASSVTTNTSPANVKQNTRHVVEHVPFPYSLICPDPGDRSVKGRAFAWGVADPLNPDHCDFTRLRDTIFYELRDDLRTAARERWYEAWRTSRLKRLPGHGVRRAPGHSPLGIVTPGEGDSPTVPISLTSLRTPLSSQDTASTMDVKPRVTNGETERPGTANRVVTNKPPVITSMSSFPPRRP